MYEYFFVLSSASLFTTLQSSKIYAYTSRIGTYLATIFSKTGSVLEKEDCRECIVAFFPDDLEKLLDPSL